MHRRTFLVAALAAAGCAQTSGTSGDPERARDIGFDLWCGRPGAQFGDDIRVEAGSRVISGPIAWRHPVTGASLPVYERLNKERSGDKVQFFTLREDGQALARVFDSRPTRSDRVFVGDAFFPLGRWTVGERRKFALEEYSDGAVRRYEASLKMRRLSFTYRGVENVLRFDWRLRDLDGRTIFDTRYEFGPGVGFINFTNRRKAKT